MLTPKKRASDVISQLLKNMPGEQIEGHFSVLIVRFFTLNLGTTVDLLLPKFFMIRKLKSGEYRLYSRKTDPKTNKRKNLGTFSSLAAAKKHEQEIQYFKRH